MISETIRKAGLGVLAGPRGFGALNTLHYIGKGFICAKIFRRGRSGTGVSPVRCSQRRAAARQKRTGETPVPLLAGSGTAGLWTARSNFHDNKRLSSL